MRIIVFLIFALAVPVCYADTVTITANRDIDPSALTEELMSAFPNSGFHGLSYDKSSRELILGFPSSTPTLPQINGIINSHDAQARKNLRSQRRASGIGKLRALGLTQSEIDVLFR